MKKTSSSWRPGAGSRESKRARNLEDDINQLFNAPSSSTTEEQSISAALKILQQTPNDSNARAMMPSNWSEEPRRVNDPQAPLPTPKVPVSLAQIARDLEAKRQMICYNIRSFTTTSYNI